MKISNEEWEKECGPVIEDYHQGKENELSEPRTFTSYQMLTLIDKFLNNSEHAKKVEQLEN